MSESKLKVAIIVGSTRPGSVGGKVAQWYLEQAKEVEGIYLEAIDLNEVNLPFLDEPMPPQMGQYTHEHTKKWSEKIAGYDAYVWVTAEYNHSIPAALKNAIDYLFKEWNDKPVALVSYGSMGGVRAAEHLRQVAGELQMADIRLPIMIRNPWAMFDEEGNINPELVSGDVSEQLKQLKWWGDALKTARNK
jgi:NAD(P)H-dependent FMN reductase